MTKIVKFWKKTSFWFKLKAFIALFSVGGEIALIIGESHHGYKLMVGVAALTGWLITQAIADVNQNGIVDIFEKDSDPTKTP